MITHDYLTPDIYASFNCLCGGCRSTCCAGLEITISLGDWNRLETASCTSDLRRRLDDTIKPADYPDKVRYAVLCHGWDGKCRLLDSDGLCAVQKELGETAMNGTCRYYPRSMRSRYGYQAATANSCEATIRLLMKKEEPLSFVRRKLSFEIAGEEPEAVFPGKAAFGMMQSSAIKILQNRDFPLKDRFIHLGQYISRISGPLSARDDAALMKAAEIIPYHEPTASCADTEEVIMKLAEAFSGDGDIFAEYLGKASVGVSSAGLKASAGRLYELVPLYQRHFEQITVNHVFYSLWPLESKLMNAEQAYIALCAAFLLLFFAEAGCAGEGGDPDTVFTDIAAAAFRNIENSNFDERAAALLIGLGFDTAEKAGTLISGLPL